MAHLSGYGGALTWSGSPSPDWNVVLRRWSLDYEQRVFETTVMATSLPDTPAIARTTGLGDWRATAEFLPHTTLAVADLTVGQAVIVRFNLVSSTPNNDYWQGTAIIRAYNVECPLDGPIVGRAMFAGNGALSYTV